jgi:hypothetical protein
MLMLSFSLLFSAAFGGAAAAQDAPQTADSPRENVILTNVFLYPFGVFNVEYERVLDERWGVTGAVTGFFANGTLFDSSVRSRGFGVGFGGRYYLTGAAPTGVFLAAFLRAFHVDLETSNGNASGFAAGAGAMLGVAHVLWRTLHVSAGGGAHVLVGDVAGTHLMPDGWTIDPEVRLALGVAF